MTSYLVIVNPASGRGRARLRADVLRSGLPKSCHVEVVETGHRGAAAELAASRATSVDRIIAVGGDGTLNEVLSGLVATGRSAQELPELSFLPAGTANAATRAFGFNSDPDTVAGALPEVDSRPVDVGIVSHEGGERPFLLWFGAGYDAVVIEALNATRTGLMGLSGLLANSRQVLGALNRYAAPQIEMEVDGSSFGLVSSVFLANVREVAFGGILAETADPFDGQLDVVAVTPGSRSKLIRQGLSILTASLARAKGVRHTLGIQIKLNSPGRVPFQLDGEPVGVLPAAVRLKRGAVRLLLT